MNSEPTPSPLTPRQTEIVKLLADGKSAEVISELLGIRRFTVNSYIERMMNRTGTSKQSGLVALCLRKGWIE